MKTHTIALDLDDTLVVCGALFRDWHNAQFNTNIQLQDLSDYNWGKVFGLDRPILLQRFSDFIGAVESPLLPEAKEALNILSHHTLYLVTARPPTDIVRQKTQQLADALGVFSGVHYSEGRTKGEVCAELGCTLLIDDNANHAKSMVEKGMQAILINQSWNQQFEVGSIPRVRNVLEAAKMVDDILK